MVCSKSTKMVVLWTLLVTFVASGLGAVIPKSENASFFDGQIRLERNTCGRVWITIHALEVRQGTNTVLDAIELNWDYTGCPNVWRRIGLFNSQPGATSWNNALVAVEVNLLTGRLVTNIPLGDENLPGGWENGQGTQGAHCMWPWIGGGETTIAIINCLKIQPTWMEENAASINHLRLGELALPGTHNAGSWRFDTPLTNAARDSFVLCQDRSIWAQLVHGIRYLDFRASYYTIHANEDDRYWMVHNFIRVRPLIPLLREIRRFLDSTRELVILHFHQFPTGFSDNNVINRNVHAGLLRILERELGPHIASAQDFPWPAGSRGPVLSNFINANRRLIIPYNQNQIVNENNWLFPQLPHLWANTNNVNQLFNFLDAQLQTQNPRPNERNPMHSAMAQTTLTATDIALFRSTIRQTADDVNHIVTSRSVNQWRRTSNIIASDFFLGNDVIDMSILVSRERGLQKLEMSETDVEDIASGHSTMDFFKGLLKSLTN